MSTLKQLLYIAPIVAVGGWAVILLTIEVFAKGPRTRYAGNLALIGLGIGFALAYYVTGLKIPVDVFGGRVLVDKFFGHISMLVCAGAALTVLLSPAYLEGHGIDFEEYYPLLLFSVAGMMIIAASGDLMVLIIGIETMTLPIYALCGAWRKQTATVRGDSSVEAAFKYYIIGAFSTAVAAYGLALVYGATETTILRELALHGASHADKPLFIVGMVMLIASLAFKVAAVPFHMWTPDVYEGAPTPVTGFMAAAVKTAAFAAVLRALVAGFGVEELAYGPGGWTSVVALLAAATMIFGNFAALRQKNVKRMLAYSSIGHAGYILLGVIAAAPAADPSLRASAQSSVVFYLWAYTFTTIGAFGVVGWIGRREQKERVDVDDFAGLNNRSPAAALAMTVFLVSLAGIPPTAGFFGKLFIFKAALANDSLLWLVIIGVLTSVVSVYYYLRVVVAMYFRDPVPGDDDFELLGGATTRVALAVTAGAVVAIGLFPNLLWKAVGKAAMLF